MCDTKPDSFKNSLLPSCSCDVLTASALQTLVMQASLLNINYFLKGLLSRSSTPPQPAATQQVCAAPLCMAAHITSVIHNSFGIHKGMDMKEWLGFISVYLYSYPCSWHQWSSHTVCQWQSRSSAWVIEFLGRSVHWQLLGMPWCLSGSQIKAGRQLTGRLGDLWSAKTGPWTSVKSLQHGEGKIRPILCHKWLLQDSSVAAVNSAWQGIFTQIIHSSFSYKALACFLSKSHVSYSHL